MTSPTAADFATARFAEHTYGDFAARVNPDPEWRWLDLNGNENTDQEMADNGWRIVSPALDPSDPDVIEQAARRAYEVIYSGTTATPWDLLHETEKDYWRSIARAVLTPPPARDPEADKLRVLINEWSMLAEPRPGLHEWLAPRGARVGGGEGATPATSTVPRSGMCRDDR